MKKIIILFMWMTISLVSTAQKPSNNGYLSATEAPWVTLTSGTGGNLYAVRFIGADAGYVAGEGGVMLKTTNGGASWSQLFTGTSMPLMSLSFTDVMHGFAAGIDPFSVYGGFILKTIDGGATWTTPLASGSR